MKGALGLIAVCVIIWGFWMTYEFVRQMRKGEKK